MLEETVVDKRFIRAMGQYRRYPSEGDLLEHASKSVIFFAEKMLGITLYAWQVKFLTDMQGSLEGRKHNISAAITSRQIGKSTSVAIFALWASVFNKKPGTIHMNTNVLVVSRSDDQAKKLLREIRKLYRFGDRFIRTTYVDGDGKAVYGDTFFTSLLSKDDPNNATMITFDPHNEQVHGEFLLAGSKYGSSVICLPPTAGVLGYTFSIGIVDEAGHESISDGFWYDELFPTGDSTDAMWVFTSTPWKPTGFFFEYIDPHDEYGSVNYVNRVMFSIEALKDDPNPRARKQYVSVKANIKEQYESKGRFDEIKRGWYCQFVKGDTNFFNPDSVRAAFDDTLKPVDSYDDVCDMGVDFGGSVKSRTVITISKLDAEDNIIRLYHKRYPVDDDLDLMSDIEELKERFNVQRVCVDDCPAGQYLIKLMEQNGWEVTRMNFRRDKVSKYKAFKDKLYKGECRSYVDDVCMTEMLALENQSSSRQSVIGAPKGYTDDLIDSWLISSYHFLEVDTPKFTFYTSRGVFNE